MICKSIKILIVYCFCLSLIAEQANAAMTEDPGIDDVKVDLKVSEATLDEIFRELQRETIFSFSLGDQIINEKKEFSYNFHQTSLKKVLDAITSNANLEYKVLDDRVLVKPFEEIKNYNTDNKNVLQAILQGTVYDDNGMPMPGVSVVEKGTNNGTTTDFDGDFSLDLTTSSPVIGFSYVGFKTQEVALEGETEISVSLSVDSQSLDEVVVVGYGTQKKANLTGAVDQIDSETLGRLEVNTIGEALQGQIPNLNVNIADGKPGRSATFNIRGTSSINGGEPLIIIDGVASSAQEMNNISPKDIESVSVLKDASSAAIYGARGAFGVILITTKRARPGEFQVNYSNNFGWSSPTRITELYDAPDYTTIINQFASNVGQSYFTTAQVNYFQEAWENPSLPDGQYNGSVSSLTLFGNNMTNYYKDWFRDSAPKQNHNVSIMGGSEKFSYFLSGDYNREEGHLKFKPDVVERFNLRSNITYTINDNISIFNNTSITSRNDDMAYTNVYGWISNVYRMIELINPYIPESIDVNGTNMLTDMGFYRSYIQDYSSNTTELNSFSTTPGFDITLLDGDLQVHGDFTYKQSNTNNLQWADIRIPHLYLYSNNNAITENYPNGNSFIARAMSTNKSTYANVYATYSKLLGELHQIEVIGGFNYEDTKYFSATTQRADPFQVAQSSLNLADGIANTNEIDLNSATQSTFFRATYNFDERYLLEANGAYNISSKFPLGERDALFSSVSGAWRVSEEQFFDNLKGTINELKIRGSYGSIGNQNIGAYDYLSMLNMYQTSYELEGARQNYTQSPDPKSDNFTWETSQTTNLGLDLNFLGNRLTFSGDVFQRNTQNMLAKFHSLPSVYGAPVPKENNAKLRTKGWEISIGWRDGFDLGNKDFNYGVRAGVSDYTSKIVDYYNATNYLNDYYPGQTIGEIWGLTNDGYFETDEEAQNGPLLNTSWTRGYAAAGYIRFEDLDGDGEIGRDQWTLENPGDFKVIGNSTPRYQYSFTLNATWNGFDFNAFFKGVGKRDIFPDHNSISFWGPYARKYAIMPQFVGENIWTPENPDAYFPRPQAYIAGGGDIDLSIPQTKYLQDASYLRLKNLSVGYTIPREFSQRIKLQKLRIYMVGQNLFEVTNLNDALDPEGLAIDPDATDVYVGMGTAYPIQRTYSVGLDLQF